MALRSCRVTSGMSDSLQNHDLQPAGLLCPWILQAGIPQWLPSSPEWPSRFAFHQQWGLLLLHVLVGVWCWRFTCGLSGGCVVGLAALVPISLMTRDTERLFIGAYLPSSCFVEVSVQVFILYFNQVVFLLLSFKSFLHTFLMYFYIFCICELLFQMCFLHISCPSF